MYYITYALVYMHASDRVLIKCYTSLHGNVHAYKMQIISDCFQAGHPHLILSI